MTETQRDAITSPALGLMVFNTTTKKPNYYDGTAWVLADGTATTLPASGTVQDYEGNTYNYATIGSQVWMTENIKSKKYSDGTSLVDGTSAGDISDDITTKYYFAYDNNESNVSTYGRLYTWAAAMNGASSSAINPSNVQGICPNGWHLPSDDEWTELTTFLGGISVAGGKMKEPGTTHWNSPNTGANNSSGFTALPGGYRYYHGAFHHKGNYAHWWSATQVDATSAWHRVLDYSNGDALRDYANKESGFSVRCLRN